ncbi:hypothetical protein NMY22_g10682 [Coprinellus aureogranulatus]|nr:hypothetical protein NMY22_g10682 [Coprinellus aureogranulatus]
MSPTAVSFLFSKGKDDPSNLFNAIHTYINAMEWERLLCDFSWTFLVSSGAGLPKKLALRLGCLDGFLLDESGAGIRVLGHTDGFSSLGLVTARLEDIRLVRLLFTPSVTLRRFLYHMLDDVRSYTVVFTLRFGSTCSVTLLCNPRRLPTNLRPSTTHHQLRSAYQLRDSGHPRRSEAGASPLQALGLLRRASVIGLALYSSNCTHRSTVLEVREPRATSEGRSLEGLVRIFRLKISIMLKIAFPYKVDPISTPYSVWAGWTNTQNLAGVVAGKKVASTGVELSTRDHGTSSEFAGGTGIMTATSAVALPTEKSQMIFLGARSSSPHP